MFWGVVEGVFRYPVKSLGGESVDSCFVGFEGLVGDRVYAVVDAVTGFAVSAKKEPRLLSVSAKMVDEELMLVFPDGRVVARDEADDALTRFLGREVKLVKNAGRSLPFTGLEIDFDQGGRLYEKTGETKESRFHDSQPIHLIRVETLIERDLSIEDIPRFRPNIVYSSSTKEDSVIGGYMQVGDAVLKIVKPTKRCIVITHPQPGISQNIDLLKRTRTNHGGKFGLYAVVLKPGTISMKNPIKFYPAETSST
ncbi:MAG: MOSC N-terminal beta barrel domain-containing protein [Candidatus Caldarchaeum sp.]